jgi:hypothetical protein
MSSGIFAISENKIVSFSHFHEPAVSAGDPDEFIVV